MLGRLSLHHMVGIILLAFGVSVVFLRSDVMGVTAVLHDATIGDRYVGRIVGVALADWLGMSIMLGGLLYLLSILFEKLDRFWWHYFCSSSLLGYVVAAYIFLVQQETAVPFMAYVGLLLMFWVAIAYHHRYEVVAPMLRKWWVGGNDV